MPRPLHEIALAAAVASVVSGVPSTAHAVLTGRPPLEAARAAATLLPGHRDRPGVANGLFVHVAVSAGWGAVLGLVLPKRHTVAWGAAAGLAIAALDLGGSRDGRRPRSRRCRKRGSGLITSPSGRPSAGYCPVPMLRLPEHAYLALVGHALDGYPLEACGLLAGSASGSSCSIRAATRRSRRRSTRSIHATTSGPIATPKRVDSKLVGVVHSHTHTDPYPSPTDVAQAPDPAWHYVIVSLREAEPMLRSYRIVGRRDHGRACGGRAAPRRYHSRLTHSGFPCLRTTPCSTSSATRRSSTSPR